MNKLLKKMNEGNCVYGPFMKTGDPAFVEIVGHSGFDFAILDLEHGPSNELALQNLVRGAQIANLCPIVRVAKLDENLIGKALDVGAQGVQIPQVTSSKEAVIAVKAAKFAPLGERGVCRFVRAANYSSKDRFEYLSEANDNLVILQLEGQEAIENLDEILEVSGIDVIFVGPYDLSQSIGVPGNINHPLVEEKMKYIIQKASEKGILTGTFVDTVEDATKWKNIGVSYISYSVDVGMFYETCKNILSMIKMD